MRRVGAFVSLVTLLSIHVPCTVDASRLAFVQKLADTQGGYHLQGAHAVAVSPDGRNVYAVSFDANALVVLARDLRTGRVAFSEAHVEQGTDPRGLFRPVAVVVSPDNAHVYVGAFFGDAVAVFARELPSGQLRFVEALFGGPFGQLGLTQVHGLAMAPDGSELFVASYGDNAVTVLRRDLQSGRLQVVQTLRDVSEGGEVSGLIRPTGVAVSPDGMHVFVTGGGSSALVHLVRDKDSGLLSQQDVFIDGVDEVSGLEVPVAVAVSPDGADVYALSSTGVAHFRDTGGGRFSFVGSVAGTEIVGAGESGAPSDIVLTPQGSAVLLTRGGDDTLVLLERDAQTGALHLAHSLQDGIDSVDGLAGASALSVDPTGRWIYVAAQYDDAVSLFQRWPRCAGDCNEDGRVTIEELVLAVRALLEEQNTESCWQVDYSGDGTVTVDEIVRAVRQALGECLSE